MIGASTPIPTNGTTSVDDKLITSPSILPYQNSQHQSIKTPTYPKLLESPPKIILPHDSQESVTILRRKFCAKFKNTKIAYITNRLSSFLHLTEQSKILYAIISNIYTKVSCANDAD